MWTLSVSIVNRNTIRMIFKNIQNFINKHFKNRSKAVLYKKISQILILNVKIAKYFKKIKARLLIIYALNALKLNKIKL